MHLLDIFKRTNGEGGYNDWKLIKLVPKPRDYKEEDDLARLEVTVRGIGVRMAEQMKVGGFGAYITDDERYDYYIFKCISAPQKADEDMVFQRDGNEFTAREGEWYCEGVWLDKVCNTSNWHEVTTQRCVVRMQVVVDGDLELAPWSEENDFHQNLSRDIVEVAKERGAFKIEADDHSFLMEVARQRTSLDYEETVYGSLDDGGGEEDDETGSHVDEDGYLTDGDGYLSDIE